MNTPSSMASRVTVVMTARERHGLTPMAIDSVVAHSPQPLRLLYLDVCSPPWLRRELAARAQSGQLEWRAFDESLWPQEVRRRVVADLHSEYVVFIDNDVVVAPGWLEALVRCADETGAGIVAPLYLWSDGVGRPTIHMAGGRIVELQEANGRVLDESHFLMNADPDTEVLQRRQCDFGEFHGLLIRHELLDDPRMFDPAIRCVHEHIDAALVARERGFPVWFEPASRITYLAFSPYMLDDLPMLRTRWNVAEGEASIAAFAAKWNVIDDARSFGGIRRYIGQHVARVDPVRPSAQSRPEQEAPMRRDELAQTRSDLLDLAQRHGYGDADLRSLSDACVSAQLVMNAGYRPCGRAFIQHLIGTASVLVRYGFRIDVVVAGLLHAAYTHCPPFAAGPAAAIAQVESLLGGRDSRVERLVHDYTLRERTFAKLSDADVGHWTTHDAELLMLVAANELDMHLSGEIRYSGRTDAISPALLDRIDAVAQRIGARGIATSLRDAIASTTTVPPHLQTGAFASYRISGRQPGPVNMTSDLPHWLAERLKAERAPH